MWKLTPADLVQLKGGGGERFTHFMDRLIRAEAARGGVAQAEIASQLRANIGDQGADTEVKKPVPTDAGWFTVPTCWQFKAVDAKEIDDKTKKKKKNGVQTEINKPYARELIAKGYGYRFCLVGDLPPKKLKDWEAQLAAEARAIDAHAPVPRVVHGGDLLHWAERFPAIVAWLRNLTQGVFHWEAWAANRRAHTRKYVPNKDWDGIRRQILEHVQFDHPALAGEPCLFIGGAAGVGKTRLVFETLAELPQAPALVVVAEDDQEARRIGTWLANDSRQFAVLVADECSPEARYFLNENLRGHVHRVRVISIDNSGEPLASGKARVSLSASDARKNAEAILSANFEEVPEDRRRQYAELSRGFIRLAADMCERDAEIATGDMTGILGSVERYARHRLANNLDIISVLALFHKVGFRDDVAIDLEVLCQLTGYAAQQFRDAVRAIRESPGFVVQAGRYWYVTPDIVARVLFNEAWQRWVTPGWVTPNLAGFIEKLPDEMRQQLVSRVASHGGREVKDEVREFFRGWFSNLTATHLTDPGTTTLAAALVEASPEEYLPRLRAVIEAAEPDALRQIRGDGYGARWGPRRTLVWLLERLVSFPEYFADCEASLFRLALEESEPEIGNNATAVWTNLFSQYLSGTATPFEERLTYLRKRTDSSISAEARLGFQGLLKALQRSMGRFVSQPEVAGRIRPEDWSPATRRQERDCYRAALAISVQHLNADLRDEHHQLAYNVVAASLSHLLHQNLLDDLRRLVTPHNLAPHESRRIVQILDRFLEGYEESGNGRAENGGKYLRDVREWSRTFRPSDFSGRLRTVCARDPWDHRFAAGNGKDDIDELAVLISQEPSLLSRELDWLATPEARLAERFGFGLGKTDMDNRCVRMIFEHAITRKTAPVLRGYVRGMAYVQRAPDGDVLAMIRTLEATHPELAVDILAQAGDSFDAFSRILRLVESEKVPAKFLANLASGVGGRPLAAAEMDRLLPHFARAARIGDGQTLLAGVRFLETCLFFESQRHAETTLTVPATRALAWEIVEVSLPFVTGQSGSEWIDIIKKLAAFDSERAVLLLGQALLSENISLREDAESQLMKLAKDHPERVMNAFGAALLDSERGWLMQIPVYRALVCALPVEVVLTWVRKHGTKAAVAIARHLPLPSVDKADKPVVPTLLDTILSEYDDDDVLAGFLGGTHSGEAWNGNGADQFRVAAEHARRFLDSPNPRIREWARHEIDYNMHLAQWQDREYEERFLPS